MGNDNCVRFENLFLQIPADRHRCHYVKTRVKVHRYLDGCLAVFHGPRKLASYPLEGKPMTGLPLESAWGVRQARRRGREVATDFALRHFPTPAKKRTILKTLDTVALRVLLFLKGQVIFILTLCRFSCSVETCAGESRAWQLMTVPHI